MRLRKTVSVPARYDENEDFASPSQRRDPTQPLYPELLAAQTVPNNQQLRPAAFPSLPLVGKIDTSTSDQNLSTQATEEVEFAQDVVPTNEDALSELTEMETFQVTDIDTSDNDASMAFDFADADPAGFDIPSLPNFAETPVAWGSLALAVQVHIFNTLLNVEKRPDRVAGILGLTTSELTDIEHRINLRKIHPMSYDDIWKYAASSSGSDWDFIDPNQMDNFMDYLTFASHYEIAGEVEVSNGRKFLLQLGLNETMMDQFKEDDDAQGMKLSQMPTADLDATEIQDNSNFDFTGYMTSVVIMDKGAISSHGSGADDITGVRSPRARPAHAVENTTGVEDPYAGSISARKSRRPRSFHSTKSLNADSGNIKKTKRSKNSNRLTNTMPGMAKKHEDRPWESVSRPEIDRAQATGKKSTNADHSRLLLRDSTSEKRQTANQDNEKQVKVAILKKRKVHENHNTDSFAAHFRNNAFPQQLRSGLLRRDPSSRIIWLEHWLVYGTPWQFAEFSSKFGSVPLRPDCKLDSRRKMLKLPKESDTIQRTLVDIHNGYVERQMWNTEPPLEVSRLFDALATNAMKAVQKSLSRKLKFEEDKSKYDIGSISAVNKKYMKSKDELHDHLSQSNLGALKQFKKAYLLHNNNKISLGIEIDASTSNVHRYSDGQDRVSNPPVPVTWQENAPSDRAVEHRVNNLMLLHAHNPLSESGSSNKPAELGRADRTAFEVSVRSGAKTVQRVTLSSRTGDTNKLTQLGFGEEGEASGKLSTAYPLSLQRQHNRGKHLVHQQDTRSGLQMSSANSQILNDRFVEHSQVELRNQNKPFLQSILSTAAEGVVLPSARSRVLLNLNVMETASTQQDPQVANFIAMTPAVTNTLQFTKQTPKSLPSVSQKSNPNSLKCPQPLSSIHCQTIVRSQSDKSEMTEPAHNNASTHGEHKEELRGMAVAVLDELERRDRAEYGPTQEYQPPHHSIGNRLIFFPYQSLTGPGTVGREEWSQKQALNTENSSAKTAAATESKGLSSDTQKDERLTSDSKSMPAPLLKPSDNSNDAGSTATRPARSLSEPTTSASEAVKPKPKQKSGTATASPGAKDDTEPAAPPLSLTGKRRRSDYGKKRSPYKKRKIGE